MEKNNYKREAAWTEAYNVIETGMRRRVAGGRWSPIFDDAVMWGIDRAVDWLLKESPDVPTTAQVSKAIFVGFLRISREWKRFNKVTHKLGYAKSLDEAGDDSDVTLLDQVPSEQAADTIKQAELAMDYQKAIRALRKAHGAKVVRATETYIMSTNTRKDWNNKAKRGLGFLRVFFGQDPRVASPYYGGGSGTRVSYNR